MKLLQIFLLIALITVALIYARYELENRCVAELMNSGVVRLYLRRILSYFFSSVSPVPNICALSESFDNIFSFPLAVSIRMLFVFVLTFGIVNVILLIKYIFRIGQQALYCIP